MTKKPKIKRYLNKEFFKQDGKFSSAEHMRRHKEIIKQRKKDREETKKAKRQHLLEIVEEEAPEDNDYE